MGHAPRRPPQAARQYVAPVDPDEGGPGAGGGPAVHGRIVAHVHRRRRFDPERVQGGVQDAGIGLGEAAALRGHDRVEELSKARGAEACVLDPVDAVRHHSEGEAAAEGREYASATRQAVAP